MSNKQVSAISWNCAQNLRDEWKCLEDVEVYMREKFSRYEIKYCIFAHEFGKQGDHPHLQGYTIFEKRYSLNKLMKDWKPAFVQASRGDSASNFDYLRKEGYHFIEFGKRPNFEEKKTKENTM
jgi:hypothetical protein